jgi:hypothetical protein
MHQNKVDASRLVFIDETWAKTNMAPLRGWCARGRRLKAKAPYGPGCVKTRSDIWLAA